MNHTVRIRPATPDDLPTVVRIANSRTLSSTSDTRGGFLVSGYDEAKYRELLDRVDAFYIAELDGEDVGFLVAYSKQHVQQEEWLNLQMADRMDDFIVIKQVAVTPEASGRGIGTRLYEELVQNHTDVPIIAAIVTEPANPASERLHARMGFTPLHYLTPPEDGIPRAVWVKAQR